MDGPRISANPGKTENYTIREAVSGDLPALLSLYAQLHGEPMPQPDARYIAVWERVLADKRQHILVGIAGGRAVSTCVLVIVENLTHNARPWAVVENVVTDEAFRGRGYATALLGYAAKTAAAAGCYRVVITTRSKKEETLRFYERAGFNRRDKTAFVRWL